MAKQTYLTEMDMAECGPVKLTLAYRYQRMLERQKPDAFAAYSKAATKGIASELDAVDVLYAAYCCGCYAQGIAPDDVMDIDDFEDSLPPRKAMYEAMAKVIGPNS